VLWCPRDPMREKAIPQGAAVRTYSMPQAGDGDEPRGVGDFSDGDFSEPPRQFRIGADVPDASATFLVVERSAAPFGAGLSTNVQGGQFFAEIDRPQQQMPGQAYLI